MSYKPNIVIITIVAPDQELSEKGVLCSGLHRPGVELCQAEMGEDGSSCGSNAIFTEI